MNKMKQIYILQSQPILIDDVLCNDFIYIDEENIKSDKNKLKILRIENIKLQFLCAKPPKMEMEQFNEIAEKITSEKSTFCNPINYFEEEYNDSQLFTFENKLKYLCFESNNPKILKDVYLALKIELERYYTQFEEKDLSGYDLIFYNQTESPFRFLNFSTDINQIQYYLSCKYDIPCVGKATINLNETKQIFTKDRIKFQKIYSGKFKNLKKIFVTNQKQSNEIYNSIKICSYDIETYNKGKVELNEKDVSQPIIAIGFAFFTISNPIPLKRYCIISRDFDKIEFEHRIEIVKINSVSYKLIHIYDYTEASDETTYIITKNEKEILEVFFHYLNEYKPYFISGFNNWTFDDKWVNAKAEQYKIEKTLLDSMNLYKPSDEKFDLMNGKYQTLNVKLDNEVIKNKNSYATWRNTFTISHDTMFAALKEDPKRFSNRVRKNLDTMLETYKICNPYNNQSLSKTGLSIQTMFRYWDEHRNTYEIAKYCCQDAWITGTFAVKRNMYGDLIEMSNMTNTTTQDSVYRAVNIRVGNTIASYAYHENFALFDLPDRDSRSKQVKSILGNKYYDRRTLIGGMVKNKRNGREKFIVALDFSSMYPSQKEGSNVDTSSRVSKEIIENYQEYGLELLEKYYLEDMYGSRWFYKFKYNDEIYDVEEMFTEFKIDKKKIKQLREEYKEVCEGLKTNQNDEYLLILKKNLLKYFRDEVNPYQKEIGKTIEELISNDISLPHSVKFPLYFVQSPKGINGLPTKHYSLKEKMLSDFRAKRVQVKKEMSETKDPTEKIQLSAKEKAIKVVMNSEYGQTGSDLFAHYDSDIGGAVTFASRCCIMELTSALTSTHFYVTEDFLTNKPLQNLIEKEIVSVNLIDYKPNWLLAFEGSNKSLDEKLRILKEHSLINCENIQTNEELNRLLLNSTIEKLEKYIEKEDEHYTKLDFSLPPRRITMKNLYFSLRKQYETGEKIDKIYQITLPKSQLIYQDTDSNYYTNMEIVQKYEKLNPTTINLIMENLIEHNNLLTYLIQEIISRKPIGVGFEGAFIVARYLNKKKKYYGKKWVPNMKDYIEIERTPLHNFNSYEKNYLHSIGLNENNLSECVKIKYDWKNLPDDYEKYLSLPSKNGNYNCYYSLIPYKDGSYFDVNQKIIGEKDYIDYINQCGIKCTGVDLARRDQYKFINYNHLLVIKNDLKYVNIENFSNDKLETDNNQEISFGLTPVIEKILDDFIKVSIKKYEYPLNYYAKFKVYKDNLSEVKPIVNKFIQYLENKLNILNQNSVEKIEIYDIPGYMYKPEFGQRVSYLLLDQTNEKVLSSGLNLYGSAIKDKACLTPVALFMFGGNNKREVDYDSNDYFNQDVLDILDYKDYFYHLIQSLSTYMVIEKSPEIARYLDDEFIMKSEKNEKELEKEMGNEITKIKNVIVKEIFNRYYPKGKTYVKQSNSKIKEVKKTFIDDKNLLNEIYKLEDDLKIKHLIDNPKKSLETVCKFLELSKIKEFENIVNIKLKNYQQQNLNNSIELSSKCISLLMHYDKLTGFILKSPIYEKRFFSFRICENNKKMKNKLSFGFAFRIHDSEWKGKPSLKKSYKDDILNNQGYLPLKIVYSENSFLRLISSHVESINFNSNFDTFTINIDEKNKLYNFLNFICFE